MAGTATITVTERFIPQFYFLRLMSGFLRAADKFIRQDSRVAIFSHAAMNN
jgi:hypothetical protein